MQTSEALNKVDFSIIRYASCWEDANVLHQALAIKDGEKVLSIASGGENSFALLINNPSLVLACDVSLPQLYLVELKKVAISNLSLEEYRQFIGLDKSEKRLQWYKLFKSQLSNDCVAYYDQHLKSIEDGIYFNGKFENYFKLFRTWVLPLIHTRKEIDLLMSPKSPSSQIDFYNNVWNNKRWQIIFKLFFSKTLVGLLGRDPEFLKQVKIPVSEFILEQAKSALTHKHCSENYFLQQIFYGFYTSHVPLYLKPENYIKIKSNINQLLIFNGYANSVQPKFGKFNALNLSDIFEYMDVDTFKSVTSDFENLAETGARGAYWNLMVERKMSQVNSKWIYQQKLSTELHEIDNGFFYSDFILEVKSE